MRKVEKRRFTLAIVALVGLVLLSSTGSTAQDKPKPEFFQASSMGQGNQLGRTFSINIIIDEYSPAEDKQVLVDAFNSKGNRKVSPMP